MNLKRFLWQRLPADVTFPADTDFDTVFQPWGVTIYRTAYDAADSDGNWQALLNNIQTHMREELLGRGNPDKEGQDDETVYAAQKLLSLFRLDARSDAHALAGASMDQLHEFYKAGAAGGEPMNARPKLRQTRVFLVADEEVLALVGAARQAQRQGAGDEEQLEEELFVKCVDVDYRPADYRARPGSRASQSYFGRMKLATRSLLKFWVRLENGGHLAIMAPETFNSTTTKEVWMGDDYN